MKFCMPHWNALRAAIEARGMGHLVAKTGAEAVEGLVLELEGRAAEAFFDPLMTAHSMISSHVLGFAGLYLLTGDHCPVCEFCKHAPPPPDGHRYATNDAYMIDGPADAVLAMAQEQGLVIKAHEDGL
jgi:hypothetical protein